MPEFVFQREVVLVPVPFSDLSSIKRRPVLVLSRNSYNGGNEDFLAAAITSNIAQKPYSVLLEANNMEDGALHLTSEIRCDKLYSLNRKIVVKKFGKVKRQLFKQAVQQLANLVSTN